VTGDRRVQLPANLPAEPRHHRVDTGELVLAAVELGPRAAPAVVVAHGVGSSARFVVEAFAGPVLAAGARLVAYDLRGHGASAPVRDVTRHHLDDHVGDLAAVVHHLGRSDVAVLGGVSLGGHAAVRAAVRGVAGRTVLACLPAWTGQAVPGEGPHAAVADEVRRTGIEAVVARLRADRTMPGWLRRTLVTDYERHDPASLTAALLALDGGVAPDDTELAWLDRPLAVVAWPDDPGHPLATARRWVAAAAQAALGELHLTDLDASRAPLGEVAMATVTCVRPTGSGAGGEHGLGDP
jgi:pimeloyl-ACP methyl ester carboxylesterase